MKGIPRRENTNQYKSVHLSHTVAIGIHFQLILDSIESKRKGKNGKIKPMNIISGGQPEPTSSGAQYGNR